MKPLRVLFVLSSSLGWRTYQRHIVEIASRREDIEPDFYICRPGNAEKLATRPVPVMRRRLIDPIFLWERRLQRWWETRGRHRGYAAIHVATQLCALAFVQVARNIPLTIALDITRAGDRTGFDRVRFSSTSLAAESEALGAAAHLFPMSRWCARRLTENYALNGAQVVVVPPSVEVPADEPARGRPSPDGLVKIAFIGNDFVRKGGPGLVEVHQQYLADLAELHIVSKRFSPRGRYRNVHHYPFIDNNRLSAEWLPQMDIFCLPTSRDMSSWVIAEAAAAGVPAVTFGVGGMGDLCVDGTTGYVLPRGDFAGVRDALRTLIERPELRRQLAENARRHARTSLDREKNYGAMLSTMLASASG